jgi:hypothetical protein
MGIDDDDDDGNKADGCSPTRPLDMVTFHFTCFSPPLCMMRRSAKIPPVASVLSRAFWFYFTFHRKIWGSRVFPRAFDAPRASAACVRALVGGSCGVDVF